MNVCLKGCALFTQAIAAVLFRWLCALLLIWAPVGAVASVNLYSAAAGSPFVTERTPDAPRVPGGGPGCAAGGLLCLSGTGLPKVQHMANSFSNSNGIDHSLLKKGADVATGQGPVFDSPPTLTPDAGVAGAVFSLTYGAVTPQSALLSAVLTIGGVDVTDQIALTPQGMTYEAPVAGPKGAMIWQVRATTPSGSTLSMPVSATVSSGTTEVTTGAVTFTLNGEYQTGVDAAGKPYVVVPSGTATVTDVTPSQSLFEGAVIHGLMKNPVRTGSSNPDQGYDGRWNIYDPALSEGFPLPVTAGDVLVKTVARTPHEDRKGAFDQIAALHVVASAPPAGAYLASSVQWEGHAGPEWYAADIDAFYAGLTRHSASGHAFPPYAVLMQSLDQFYPLYAQISAASGMGYENASPFGFGGGLTNYGRYTAGTIETAMLALVTDVYSEAETKSILRRLVQHGIEWGDPMIYGPASASNGPDGGHHQFHQGPVALALALTGRSAELPLLMDVAPGNWDQAIKLDAAWLSLMSDPDGPAITREQTLGSQPGGSVVRFGFENGFNGPDWYQTKIPAGARLLRPSDGVSVLVTVDTLIGDRNPSTGTYDVPVDAPSPFGAGDVIKVDLPAGWIAEGFYDWTLRGPARAHMWSPTASNQYRDLQRWGAVMALRSMGIAPANMAAVEGYLTRAGLTADPAPYNDYPPVTGPYVGADGQNYSISPVFYSQHWSGLNSGGGNSGGDGYTPDANVALTFDTALTPDAQATSMVDGIVIGLVPGSNTASVRFKGTATGTDEIEVRIRRQSGGVVQDWTPVAVSENGVWDGVLDLPKADDWWAADARPKHTPASVQILSQKFAVGYKFMWLGQSQMSIVAKSDEGVFPVLDESTSKASYYSWQDYNVGGQYSEGEQLFVLGSSNPGSDGVRSFVTQFRIFDPDTPIQIFRESVNGSSILEMLDDDEPRRSWTDLTNKTDKYGGDISVVLESWNSSNTGLFDGHQDLDMLNGIDAFGYSIEHTLPDVLQAGYVYAVQPATRRAKLLGDINHAASKIERAHVLGYPVGLPIPDYELEDFGGHALKTSLANPIMGARMALLAARALGKPAPVNPSFLSQASLNAESTIITLTAVLPNGGQLFSPAPQDLRLFAVDQGSGLTVEGFTARIAANGSQVELVRDAGATWAAPQFLKVQIYANGHLNPDLSSSGQTGTAWRAIEQAVIMGQLYETYADDVVGLGLPVAGVVNDGNWQISNTSVPLIPLVVQDNSTVTPPSGATSAFPLLSADAQADSTVAGAAEGYKRERFVVDAFVDDGALPQPGSKYLIGGLQISAIAGGAKFFDQVEVRNSAGNAIGETLEIASIFQSPGGKDMRVQAFVHTDPGTGQHLYAKSSGRQLMSYLPVYKIDGYTTAGAMTASSLTGEITLTEVPQGSAVVVFAQNRDGTEIIWGGVVEDGAYSLTYDGDARYQAAASGVVAAGGTVTVTAAGAEEMVVVVLPPV